MKPVYAALLFGIGGFVAIGLAFALAAFIVDIAINFPYTFTPAALAVAACWFMTFAFVIVVVSWWCTDAVRAWRRW
jgi:hypothetical protein